MLIQTLSLLFLCSQILLVSGSGHLYIGLLDYYNENSECCEQNSCDDYTVCNITVEVVMENSYSSIPTQSLMITDRSITLVEAQTFPDDTITNPFSFNFIEWPLNIPTYTSAVNKNGGVNVSVLIYNGSSDTVVDQFDTDITLYGPSNYYFRKSLTAEPGNNSSRLSMVFRYICDPTKGPACFTDCMDHLDNETCPPRPPTTPLAIAISTFTGFKDPKCETVDSEGNVVLTNCSFTTAPSIETTEDPMNDTETTAPPITSTTPSPTTEGEESTTEAETTTITIAPTSQSTDKTTATLTTTTAEQIITTKTTISTKRNVVETQPSASKSTATLTTITPPTVYPRDGNGQSVDVNTAYWPAIVGGVLGGVALFAATAFICYWNRQKKLQKRQEIYNVNPKILRNFEEFEENGTSGRSDVPMETEQY